VCKGSIRKVLPAYHRIHDHYPASFLTMKGEFFRAHREEVMHLVRNHEQRERKEYPLQRIMAEEEKEGATLVTKKLSLVRLVFNFRGENRADTITNHHPRY